jgi:hypothetical protein
MSFIEFSNLRQCYENHLVNNQAGKAVCDFFRQCAICKKVLDTRTTHVCFASYCNTCGMQKPKDHDCFIKKTKQSKKEKSGDSMEPTQKFIFFYFESTQEKILKNIEEKY